MIIDIILPASLIFIMFSLGLGLTTNDFKNVMNHPKAFLIGIINQMLILPLVAFCIIIFFGLSNEIAVGMMILSCCPGGVTSNIITKLAKGDTALSISYTAIVSIITVFTLPLIVGLSVSHFMGGDAPSINIFKLGMTMFIITAVPVIMGLFINTNYKKISNSFGPIANKVSSLLFIVIVAGALASEWDTFINNLYLLGPSILTLICLMLLIGYNSPKIFGIKNAQAITIAIESSIQNGTVGIAIGNIILSESQGISILSLPSGVYSILMYIVCLPVIFLFLRQK
tara:strand:+ start:9567 stop:10421 length:855 start_codon:yes stop_codon:yes gene_type:complete